MAGVACPISGRSRIKGLCTLWIKRIWIDGLVRANWLNHDRIVGWGGILLTLQVLFLGFMVLWHHNAFERIEPQSSTDFVSFYAAGKLTLAGSPTLAYDRAAHAAAEAAATQPHTPYQFFFYPPVYLFVCAALALLPYMVAFLFFQAVTLLSWMLVMRAILKARGWSWCLPVLAYPAAFWTLGLGQNAFMTAALIGGVTLLCDKRPVLAGLLLALMSFKPHLALLIPFALAAGGYWRTVIAAGIGTAAVVGLSAIVFGMDSWQACANAMAGSREVYENGSVDLAGFVTPYGAARVFGALPSQAWVVQGTTTMLVIMAVCWTWWRDPAPATRSAALVAGILLSVPLALVYDLLLLTVAMAWLVRAGREGGFRLWEKIAMFVCYLVPLVGRDLGHHFHVSLFPLAPAAILALAVARARRPSPDRPLRYLRYNIPDHAPFDQENGYRVV
jgi:alpha-1,2-mannosyltransferase